MTAPEIVDLFWCPVCNALCVGRNDNNVDTGEPVVAWTVPHDVSCPDYPDNPWAES